VLFGAYAPPLRGLCVLVERQGEALLFVVYCLLYSVYYLAHTPRLSGGGLRQWLGY